MNTFEAENRFPDCVFMKLHSAKIESQIAQKLVIPQDTRTELLNRSKQTELKITLRFGRETISVPGGQVFFAIKRGKLVLELENATMPVEETTFVTPFETKGEGKQLSEKERMSEIGIAITGIGIKGSDKEKNITELRYNDSQFITIGDENKPIWDFEAKFGEPKILKGQITKQALGIVEMTSKPSRVTAIFIVLNQRDLHLEGNGLLWPKQLSDSKRAVLEREFFLLFFAPNLNPHLSKVEVDL